MGRLAHQEGTTKLNATSVRTDDYQLRDGTILAFTPGGGYSRSDNEYQCAQDWIVQTRPIIDIVKDTKIILFGYWEDSAVS